MNLSIITHAVKCAGVLVILIADWHPFCKGAYVFTIQATISLQHILIDCNVRCQHCTGACILWNILANYRRISVYQSRKPVKFPGICDLVRVFFCTIASCWRCCRNHPCPHGRQHHCRTHTAGNIAVFTAYRAICIAFFLGAFCVTDTLWFFCYRCITDFTYISARCPLFCGNITAIFVMFMIAVQFLCDAAAFLTAHMTAD